MVFGKVLMNGGLGAIADKSVCSNEMYRVSSDSFTLAHVRYNKAERYIHRIACGLKGKPFPPKTRHAFAPFTAISPAASFLPDLGFSIPHAVGG